MDVVIAICDDLPEERATLAQMVRACCQKRQINEKIHLFSSGEDLLASFRPGRFHMVFLDIYMAGLSGMETARKIRHQDAVCALIFATTSYEHGIESFEVRASDYLVKPFNLQDVDDALEWCISNMPEEYRCLSVCSRWEQVEIPLRSIHYIEIRDHQAHIFTEDDTVVTRRGMDELENEIASEDFLRCHRSFLINMNHAHNIEGNAFRMKNGELIPIGSTSASWARERFINWTFLKTWRQK